MMTNNPRAILMIKLTIKIFICGTDLEIIPMTTTVTKLVIRIGVAKNNEAAKSDLKICIRISGFFGAEKKENHKYLDSPEKKPYMKFRWFISSDGFLCLGGRDATSNEIIIKKTSAFMLSCTL